VDRGAGAPRALRGEGLIYAVRDRVEGENKKGETAVLDEGVEDKRLLVLEAELAGVLKVMSREGNTLSPVIRQAWDDGALQTLTKNSPMKATSAHVSMVGHITKAELLRHFTETEAANGFANRFIWLLVKRSKILPFGGSGSRWTPPRWSGASLRPWSSARRRRGHLGDRRSRRLGRGLRPPLRRQAGVVRCRGR
jgi:hypothetical protein